MLDPTQMGHHACTVELGRHLQFEAARKRRLDPDRQVKGRTQSSPSPFSSPPSRPSSPLMRAGFPASTVVVPTGGGRTFLCFVFPVRVAVRHSQALTAASRLADLTPPAMAGTTVPAPAALWVDSKAPCRDHSGLQGPLPRPQWTPRPPAQTKLGSQQAVPAVQRDTATSKRLDSLEAEFGEWGGSAVVPGLPPMPPTGLRSPPLLSNRSTSLPPLRRAGMLLFSVTRGLAPIDPSPPPIRELRFVVWEQTWLGLYQMPCPQCWHQLSPPSCRLRPE